MPPAPRSTFHPIAPGAAASLSIIALTFAATACGSDSSTSEQLDGTTKLSTEVVGETLVDGTRLVVSFQDDTITVDAGCNIMGGEYTITDDRLHVGELRQTLMVCEDDLQRQETWVAEFLRSTPAVSLDDDELTLSSDTVTITFADRSDVADAYSFDGTMWSIASLDGPDGSLTPPVPAYLSVHDGQLHVATGCNNLVAEVEVTGDDIVTVGVGAMTRMACEGDIMAWETALATFLQGELTFDVSDDELVLSNDDTELHLVPTNETS